MWLGSKFLKILVLQDTPRIKTSETLNNLGERASNLSYHDNITAHSLYNLCVAFNCSSQCTVIQPGLNEVHYIV